ncbi:MAG TPA: amidase [Solirubrobacteraceae bacterium]
MSATAEELAFTGPAGLAELVRSGQVHPRELVELCLGRIESLNPRLNAFRITLADEALAAADAAAGSGGPLAGVPVAIKDDTPLAGQATTRGSRSYGPPAPADAEVVRRLREAGAIPIGITNVPELMIFPWTASDANGITRNPWAPARTPGGSSGGSAAAVASGMVPCATGSDGGGSIRIPAACCGLVGMKPTRGRISMQPFREHWLGLSTYGALARTVADSALLLDVLQGAGPGDADVAAAPARSYSEAAATAPGRLRIAVSRKQPPGPPAPLSGEQRGAWEQMGSVLSELGHEVAERHPRYGTAAIEFTQNWMRGIYQDSQTVPDPERLERSTRQMAALGRRLVSDRRAEKLRSKRGATAARILGLWEEFDVLMTPALASPPIAAEAGYGRSALGAFNQAGRFTPWTAIFNVTGQPAISIPAGFSADGLPLAVQLVGRLGAEDTLYSLAGQIEAARPWADRRPPA